MRHDFRYIPKIDRINNKKRLEILGLVLFAYILPKFEIKKKLLLKKKTFILKVLLIILCKMNINT